MNTPLNVLILEDRSADAELMVEELRRAGFTPEWRRVETESDYVVALDSDFDVILADHTLPQFNSVLALRILQERALDIPFIVVSGTINEELAVTLLKQGAADYVLKDRLTRLGQAVVHALKEKKLRQERRCLEKSLVLFRTLLDRTNDIIEVIDPETGKFLDVNAAACSSYGYTREEFLGLGLLDVDESINDWPPPKTSEVQPKLGYVRYVTEHCRKDGNTFTVEVDSNFVHLNDRARFS